MAQVDPRVLAQVLGGTLGDTAGAEMRPMAARGAYPHPQHLEDASTEWARGNMSGQDFMNFVRSQGWQIEPHALRSKRISTISVFDPSGQEHLLQP